MKQKTAMQDLREDLIDTKKVTSETFNEIKDEKLRKVIENFVQTTLDSVIERIDAELLLIEKQQITDSYIEGCRKGFNDFGEDSELYFAKTFTE